MADPPAPSALRALSQAAVERVRQSGLSVDRFRGIAFYDTAKDETLSSLEVIPTCRVPALVLSPGDQVELPGIEPGSSDPAIGLLRA